jgi:tetratricopeptide (TPR) repeat protein
MNRFYVKSLSLLLLLIIGCGQKMIVVRTVPAENKKMVASGPSEDNTIASNNHLTQARMFYAHDKFKQAIQHCEKAIEFNNRNWEAYYYMGLSMQRSKAYARSIEYLKTGLTFSPDNNLIRAEVHYAIGFSWESIGKMEEAGTQYHIALTYNPDNGSARNGMNRVTVNKTMKDWKNNKNIKHKG